MEQTYDGHQDDIMLCPCGLVVLSLLHHEPPLTHLLDVVILEWPVPTPYFDMMVYELRIYHYPADSLSIHVCIEQKSTIIS
jgi:hypothetical protein